MSTEVAALAMPSTGWDKSVGVKSLPSHETRALIGARAQLVGMRTKARF